MEFGKSDWKTFERGIEKEWLISNGIGGFSSSTIIGANSRRYHGLLVASLKPPVSRHMVLSKVDESITINGETINLFSYQTNDYIMKGYLTQQLFKMDPIPTFIYNIGDVFIKKKICMVYGKNTVAVSYRIQNGSEEASLKLTPLVNFRDYHHNSSKGFLSFNQKEVGKSIVLKPTYYDIDIKLHCSEGEFHKENDCYFYNMFYQRESERGLEASEDHYIPGYFEISLKPDETKTFTFIASVEDKLEQLDGEIIIKQEVERLLKIQEMAGLKDDFAKTLVLAADTFIVHRESTNAKTIIAGYPWFTDWGRDTMIAFTGLTLATGRFQDAREILFTFSKYVKHGMIPNVFPDAGHEPSYNTVDAALWYFEAAYKYVKYTGDYNFIKENIFEALKQIINSYSKGTLYNIKMDKDGLISAGDEGTQLTWMDAKVGDWVITPRHGKCVEINALWYNALMIMSDLAKEFKEDTDEYKKIAEEAKRAFIKLFWNSDKKCLFDVITKDSKDDKIRPNQIMAVSLSFPVLEGDVAKSVVAVVWKHLYTSWGLRSLSPKEYGYRGSYEGNQHDRDSAYHQGTVWTWPLGQFISAFIKVNSKTVENAKKAFMFIEPFKDHLRDAGIGSISEIFEGNEPTLPKGCFSQAWSVGEILRAYVEDILPLLKE
jgi:predicted glycogen debranching enzyme